MGIMTALMVKMRRTVINVLRQFQNLKQDVVLIIRRNHQMLNGLSHATSLIFIAPLGSVFHMM